MIFRATRRYINALIFSLKEMNRNITFSLLFTAFYYVSAGIWSLVLLGPYLKALKNSNASVGYAEGIQGISEALAAFPAGYLADKISRKFVLKCSFAVAIVATLFSITALSTSESSRDLAYTHMCIALIFWGICKGLWNPALEALFADSIASGNRSNLYTVKYAVLVAATASGPALNFVIFYIIGDYWSLHRLTTAFSVGIALTGVSFFVTPFLDDRFALGIESEPLNESLLQENYLVISQFPQSYETIRHIVYRITGLEMNQEWIPFIITSSDILYGIASGMTIKFFPLFFEFKSNMHPTSVSLIFVLAPLSVVVSSIMAQKLSRHYGKVQTILCIELAGIILLLVLALMKPMWSIFFVVAPVYIVRTALMNSSYPITKSILMDCVSKATRAKWNSLESITSFGWSGSAALGGFLIDRFDYGVTFAVTAGIQFISWTILLLLLPLVPCDELSQPEADEEFSDGVIEMELSQT